MKKIIILLLICSLCVSVLTACSCSHTFTEEVIKPTCGESGYTQKTCTVCGTVEKTNEVPATGEHNGNPCQVCGYNSSGLTVTDIANMYNVSLPTKAVVSVQQILPGSKVVLESTYSVVNGKVGSLNASIYESVVSQLRTVEDGGKNEDVKDIVTVSRTVIEAVEGQGTRTFSYVDGVLMPYSTEWNPEGSVYEISKGEMKIYIKDANVTNVSYSDNTLECTIPQEKLDTVFSKKYIEDMASDVQLKIVNDGAQITSVEFSYVSNANPDANLEESQVTVKIEYTYDIENINID